MLRDLMTADIYKMSKILKKMGLKVDTSSNSVDASGNVVTNIKSQQQIGAEFILCVFENLHLAEVEFNEFFADLSGMAVDEFAKLPIEKTLEIIDEFKKMPGLASFFKLASR